jgi:hypothetical protein
VAGGGEPTDVELADTRAEVSRQSLVEPLHRRGVEC